MRLEVPLWFARCYEEWISLYQWKWKWREQVSIHLENTELLSMGRRPYGVWGIQCSTMPYGLMFNMQRRQSCLGLKYMGRNGNLSTGVLGLSVFLWALLSCFRLYAPRLSVMWLNCRTCIFKWQTSIPQPTSPFTHMSFVICILSPSLSADLVSAWLSK